MAELTLDISLSGGFRLGDMERLVLALQPLNLMTSPMRVRIDLGGLAFITAAPLATLSASLAARLASGLVLPGSVYTQPRNRLVSMYLARMNFHKLFSGVEVEEEFERGPETTFTPCLWLAPGVPVRQVAEPLARATADVLLLDGETSAAVLSALREMLQNIRDHADSPVGGYAMAQGDKRRRKFELAIVDPGIGMQASLRRYPKYSTVVGDLAAIQKALTPGVTSNPGGGNAGYGLSAVRRAIRENGGVLLVRSGTAAVTSGEIESARDGLEPMPGTLVALRIRPDRPFRLALFAELAAMVASASTGAEQGIAALK